MPQYDLCSIGSIREEWFHSPLSLEKHDELRAINKLAAAST